MDEKIFFDRINGFVEKNKENFLRDMKALVDIRSVRERPEEGAPFGQGPRQALEKALTIASAMGLSTRNCEGYIGYADLPGKSERQIAIAAHLDVVPAGSGWFGDPFCMGIKDGFAVGRGTADDKGPAAVALYVAKFFREQSELLPYTLRILLGTNEETGMEDMKYYLAHYPQPEFCFVPDGRFPVGYAEKGGYSGVLLSAPLEGNLLEIYGGEARNIVPDYAYALVKGEIRNLVGRENVAVRREGNYMRIEARGISGHVAGPSGSVNAIGLVVDYLLDNRLCAPEEEKALGILRILHSGTDGSALGIAASDDVFGPLTCVGSMIRFENGILRQSVDIRYPGSIDEARLCEVFAALAKSAGGTFEPGIGRPPFSIDPELPEVRILTDTYNEFTGRGEIPFAMGGGTYARCFTKAISFGPGETEQPRPDWGGGAHGANEAVSIEQLLKALRIYIRAVARLMRI